MRHNLPDLNQLKVVIFDWDNTLAETRTALIYAINRVLEEYHLPEWKEAKKLRDNNLSFRDNFPRIFGEKATEAYTKYSEIYLQNVAGLISTFDCVLDVLTFLKKHNIIIALMSNKDRKLLEYELPLLFEVSLFDKIVCGHEAARDKPHQEQALHTLKDLIDEKEINRDTVWIVGDSPQDSTCACMVNALPIRIGSSIWGDEGDFDEKILAYDNFCEFYQNLLEIQP